MVFEVQLAVLKTDHPLGQVAAREEVGVSSLAVAQTAALASSFPEEEEVGREFLGRVMAVAAYLEVVVVVVVESEASLAGACPPAKPGPSRVVVVVEEAAVEPFLKSPWLQNHLRIGFRSTLAVVEEAGKCWNLVSKTGVSPQFQQCLEVVVVGWFVAVEEVEEGQGELGVVL